VKFLCARLVDKKLQIFMELHTGSLEALINEHAGSASLRSLADAVAVQILFALQHLHTVHGIYHRDIKPGNILYTEVNGQYVFRLSDFGLSKFSTRPSNSNIGTEFFKAPEVGTSDNQTDRMDIYSLYMTLVYILDVDKCRTRAFEFRGKRHLVLETARNGATEVLKQYKEMSKINPSARASATDMLFKLLPTVYMTSKPEEETAAPDAAPGLQVHGDNDDPAAMEGTPHPRKRRRVENTGKETVTKARTDDHTEAHKTPISTTEPEHRERVKSSNMNENSPGRSLSIQRPLSLRPSRRGKMTEQDN
jgi:serine/threonine protein kinase